MGFAFTAMDIAARILKSEILGRVLTAAGRAALRTAARELTRRVTVGEARPSARRYRRGVQSDKI